MKIDKSTQMNDELVLELYQAYEIGAQVKSANSIPCSICRKDYELNGEVVARNHFHGSDLGACKRKTFLLMRDGGGRSSSNAAFLNDGHLHEASMLSNLIAGLPDSWAIRPMENKTEHKFNVFGFEIIGHIDALLVDEIKGEMYILECKSVKDYTFKKVKGTADTDGEISNEWYGQAHSYMLMLQLKVTYFVVKDRTTAKILPPVRVDFNAKFAAERLNALKDIYERLITGGEQPNREHTTSKDSECKFCPFGKEIGNNSCWGMEKE